MNNNIVVANAKYLSSAVEPSQYPAEKRPEIVFIGRSNVGKSSLINTLVNHRNLARISKEPGKTKTINYFDVTLKMIENDNDGSKAMKFYLVDLPGYGYARVSRTERKKWQDFIKYYLLNSPYIQFVSLLIDIRHAPLESDISMFDFLVKNNIPVLIVATKSDKIGKRTQEININRIKEALGVPEIDVLPFSSLKKEGRSDLLDVIVSALMEYENNAKV